MSAGSSLREQLRRQTGIARLRLAAVDTDVERRRGGPPEAGDLFVLSETQEHAVEWAILDRDPEDPSRLLAIPADANSLVGSCDVAVPEDAPRGCLSLRCGHAVWLDAGALEPGMRTGFLDRQTIARARRKRDGVERGAANGTVLERGVDGEAEYREWARTLEAARAAVPERRSESQRTGDVVPFRRPSRWRSMVGPFALAASILLVMTVGLGRKLMRAERGHQAVVANHRTELAEREQERQRLEEDQRQDLARLKEEHQRTALEHQQRIAALEAAAQPKPLINLPFVVLAAGQLRGEGETLEVATQASWILLILQVEDPGLYSRYRLDIRETTSQRPVWRSSGLEVTGLAELSVALPRVLVPDGQYELRLYGMRDSRAEKLMERILTVASE